MYKMNVYKKTNGSLNFRRNGKAIRIDVSEGEVTFEAYPYEIPEAFMDTIVLIKDNNKEPVEEEVKVDDPADSEFPQDDVITEDADEKPAYKLVQHSRGWYSIEATFSDGTVKTVSERKKRIDEAQADLDALIG